MRLLIILLIAFTLIAALNTDDSRADSGASYSTGAGIKLPIMGVSKFGEASFGVVTIPTGDLNGDGIVDIADALFVLQISIGLKTATPAQIFAGDVAPLVNGKPAPNGSLDISDAVIILRKALGLLTW